MDRGQISLASQNAPIFHVHPVVIFSILDAYKRRQTSQRRVIGTLLGERMPVSSSTSASSSSSSSSSRPVIVVRSSFPVPHQEDEDNISVDMDYHEKMLALHRQAAPRDVVLGWYSTGAQLTYTSSLIHNVYRDQIASTTSLSSSSSSSIPAITEPVLIVVDVSVQQLSMNVRAYLESRIAIPSPSATSVNVLTPVMAHFMAVPCEIIGSDAERVGVDGIIQGEPDSTDRLDAPSSILSEDEQLDRAIRSLYEALDVCHAYVVAVQQGKLEGDAEFAYRIHQTLQGIPLIEPKSFAATLTTHLARFTHDPLLSATDANSTEAGRQS